MRERLRNDLRLLAQAPAKQQQHENRARSHDDGKPAHVARPRQGHDNGTYGTEHGVHEVHNRASRTYLLGWLVKQDNEGVRTNDALHESVGRENEEEGKRPPWPEEPGERSARQTEHDAKQSEGPGAHRLG